MREEAGIGTGFEELAEAEGVSKSLQEELEAVLGEDWDPLDTHEVEKATDDIEHPDRWTARDFEDAHQTSQERREALLRRAVGELHALRREQEFGSSGSGGTGVSKGQNAVELLEEIEDELERQDEDEDGGEDNREDALLELTGEQARALEESLNGFADDPETEGLDAPIGDVLQYAREDAGSSSA